MYAQWDEGAPYLDALEDGHSSRRWVTRLQNIRGLTRLRLRVVIAPTDGVTFLNLSQDPVVIRTVHFLSMLRGSMLVNGDALGVASMSVWLDQRLPFQAGLSTGRAIVQCDDIWDEESGKHSHRMGDDDYGPIYGSNLHQYFA
jgi:hypothetical protein